MRSPADRLRLRTVFDDVAEAYDRARPTYPAAVFDDLAALTGLRPGARLVEIGCGPGKATLALAERGYAVTCIELGARMAALARRNLAAYPAVEVLNVPFEPWQPQVAGYDAVVAFTAFHWIDPDVRYQRAADVLRPGGHLGVLETKHVSADGGDPFWLEVQDDYVASGAATERRPPPRPEEVPDLREEIEASGRFDLVGVRRHLWSIEYDVDAFLEVLDTHSRQRGLAPDVRADLYERIERRVRARPQPSVRTTYLGTLNVARVREDAP
jgi:SAM-dependent methyltransferase